MTEPSATTPTTEIHNHYTDAGSTPPLDAEARRFIEWLGAQAPMWQQATCCSFAIGSHYNNDGSVGGGLVPPHEPVIDPESGVVSVQYKSIRDLLARLAPARNDAGEPG